MVVGSRQAGLSVRAELLAAVERGDVVIAGVDDDGELRFRLTEQGERAAEEVFRRVGIDPERLDAEAVRLALHRLDAEEQAGTS